MKSSTKTNMQIDSTRGFIHAIKTALDKLTTPSTVNSVLSDLKEIMQFHTTNQTRMNLLITILFEHTKSFENLNRHQKNDTIKVYALMGEVFGENLISCVPKLISSLKLRWEDPSMHIPLSEAFEVMMQSIFKQSNNSADQFNIISLLLIDTIREKQENNQENIQIGAAMCLSRIVQILPLKDLMICLDDLANTLEKLLSDRKVSCTVQLLEILVTLIVSADTAFEEYTESFIPILMDKMGTNQDWLVRKLAIDAVGTLAEFVPKSLGKRKRQVILMLKQTKSDRSENVKKAAHDALTKLNNIESSYELERGERNSVDTPEDNDIEHKADRRMYMTIRDEMLNEWEKKKQTRTPKEQKVRFSVKEGSSEDEKRLFERRNPYNKQDIRTHNPMLQSTEILSGEEIKNSLDRIAKVRL